MLVWSASWAPGGTAREGAAAAGPEPGAFATLGPGSCAKCHREQNDWWFDDAHYASADPLADGEPRYVQIGALAGLARSEIARGDRVCVECHGTVVSGRDAGRAAEGVSCESCHGPAEKWLGPHQEIDPSPGAESSVRDRVLELGLRDLRRARVRARTCTDCHYITQPLLLSAGHPSGLGFDYVGGIRKVRHWRQPLPADQEIWSSFDDALAARGRVPLVDRSATARVAASLGGLPRRRTWRSPARGRLPRRRPAGEITTETRRNERPLVLPAFSNDLEEVSIEEALRGINARLRLLARAVRERAGDDA